MQLDACVKKSLSIRSSEGATVKKAPAGAFLAESLELSRDDAVECRAGSPDPAEAPGAARSGDPALQSRAVRCGILPARITSIAWIR
jgi:hypothetical protein